MEAWENKFTVGEQSSITRKILKEDILTFAKLTGDYNPIHVNEEYAKKSLFKENIAHGLLIGGLISAVLGMKLPGPGAIYLSQTFNFKIPVKIGDEITATAQILEILKRENRSTRMRLSTICQNQNNQIVLDGEAVLQQLL